MSYSTSNPPRLYVPAFTSISTGSTLAAGFHGGPNIWSYISADATNTVSAAGYITNGQDLGMKQGDLVFVTYISSVGSTSIQVASNVVQAVTSTGVTLSAAVSIGATS